MLHLIKKDFLLVRKMGVITLLLAFVVPLFLHYVADGIQLPSGLTIATVSILLLLMLFNSIFQEEEKYPKATALLTTVGYSRRQQVVGRFVLSFLFFGHCVLAYSLLGLVISDFAPITSMNLIAAFCTYAVFTSLYLLLTYLLGIRASQYLTMAVILLISLGPTLLVRLNIHMDLSFLQNISSRLMASLLLIVGIVVYLLSYMFSLNSFQRKEL